MKEHLLNLGKLLDYIHANEITEEEFYLLMQLTNQLNKYCYKLNSAYCIERIENEKTNKSN